MSTDQASNGYVLMKLAQHVLARRAEPFFNPGRSTRTDQGPVFPPDTHLLDKLGFAPRGFSVGVGILNDDTTPMDFVIAMLMRHVKMDRDEAMRTMFEIHLTGGKIVAFVDRTLQNRSPPLSYAWSGEQTKADMRIPHEKPRALIDLLDSYS